MTEFEKAATAMKTEAIAEFKKRIVSEIIRTYEHEYPMASGELDEFYHEVLNLIQNA